MLNYCTRAEVKTVNKSISQLLLLVAKNICELGILYDIAFVSLVSIQMTFIQTITFCKSLYFSVRNVKTF